MRLERFGRSRIGHTGFQSRRPGFGDCDQASCPIADATTIKFQSRRPGFGDCDHGLPDNGQIGGCFSPVDRDLGIATGDQAVVRSEMNLFQSRRPGFGDCDNRVAHAPVCHIIGFSPVDRDLGIATGEMRL